MRVAAMLRAMYGASSDDCAGVTLRAWRVPGKPNQRRA